MWAFSNFHVKQAPMLILPNQISDEVKTERYHRLMQVQKKVVKKQLNKTVGKKYSSSSKVTIPNHPF